MIEGIAAGSAYSTASLDAPALVEGPGSELGAEDPGFGYVADSSVVGELISRLPPREREIVRLRFYEELTQGEIADRMGMSQMHVSRLLRRSFEQMRRQLDVALTRNGFGAGERRWEDDPMSHRSAEELTAGLDEVARSPVGAGRLEMIVRRPAVDAREVLDGRRPRSRAGARRRHVARAGQQADRGPVRGSGAPAHADERRGPLRSSPSTASAGRSQATSSSSTSTSARPSSPRDTDHDRRHRGDRGDRAAAHRLCQVLRPLRCRRAARRQLAAGTGTEPSGDQRPRRRRRDDPCRRRGPRRARGGRGAPADRPLPPAPVGQ